jgi:hypothetical protein
MERFVYGTDLKSKPGLPRRKKRSSQRRTSCCTAYLPTQFHIEPYYASDKKHLSNGMFRRYPEIKKVTIQHLWKSAKIVVATASETKQEAIQKAYKLTVFSRLLRHCTSRNDDFIL